MDAKEIIEDEKVNLGDINLMLKKGLKIYISILNKNLKPPWECEEI
jgi:hypothetical protein